MDLKTLVLEMPESLLDPGLYSWLAKVEMWAKSVHNDDVKWSVGSIRMAKGADPFGAEEKLANLKAQLEVLSMNEVQNATADVSQVSSLVARHGDIKKNRVFIVHGHNKPMRLEVKDFLSLTLGYDVCVLDEQRNRGRTIIEKFLDECEECDKAIVLYSPDDVLKNGKKFARQNVLFEHGYLWAKFGRENVIAMADGNVEFPSDLNGVVYIKYKDDWKERIRREWGECKLSLSNIVDNLLSNAANAMRDLTM